MVNGTSYHKTSLIDARFGAVERVLMPAYADGATMIYDITPPITAQLAVWPGDTPPARQVLLDLRRGDNITLSSLHATVHLGAHADAPSHYGADAPAIDQRDLDYYLGPCQV